MGNESQRIVFANSKVSLSPVMLTPEKIADIQTNGILNGFSFARDAQGEWLDKVAFKQANGEYKSTTIGAPDIDTVINKDSIAQVQINVGNGNRYFKRIDYLDDFTQGHNSGTGLKATAWLETDNKGNPIKDRNGKQEVRVQFTGFLGGQDAKGWVSDAATLHEVANARLSPQTTEAARFTQRVIDKVGADNISNLNSGAHSFGGVNAIMAQLVGDVKGVPHLKQTVLIDPGRIGYEQEIQLIAALKDPSSPLSKAMQGATGKSSADITNAVNQFALNEKDRILSITQVKIDENGNLRSSSVNNAIPGIGADFTTPPLGAEFSITDTSLLSGAMRLALDRITNTDAVVSGEGKVPGTQVLVMKKDLPGYKTSAKVSESLHQEVPTIASMTDGKFYMAETDINPAQLQRPTAVAAATQTSEDTKKR